MGDFVEVFESHNRKGGGVEAARAGIVGGVESMFSERAKLVASTA
jgi:hypothetical protein